MPHDRSARPIPNLIRALFLRSLLFLINFTSFTSFHYFRTIRKKREVITWRTFQITNKKDVLLIDADLTKMKTLKQIVMITAKEYIKAGKVDELKGLMARIEDMTL